MQKTIFITGASSGLGKATVKLFQAKGWNVIATMRNPEKENELKELPNVTLVKLDVIDGAAIQKTVSTILQSHAVDVVLNNAGYGLIGPGQLLKMQDEEADYNGMALHIHPDFIRHYSLNTQIKQYGFFGYSAAEALYLSEKEKATILSIYRFIQEELSERIDKFSQDVIISQIELLLNYSNRFYDRQFLTRKAVNNDILSRLEELLKNYFIDNKLLIKGLPTVNSVAENLNVTPRYLSDLLRNLIGLNTQHLIHEKVIEKAKEYLAKDELTIAEIAYHLGFEHPQSFNKLFKSKTSFSPSDYKKSLQN